MAVAVHVPPSSTALACSQPQTWKIAAGFDLAASGSLPSPYPTFPVSSRVRVIPPSLLKAVGWIESGWRQFTPQGRPVVSYDFGYGIMQVTSGMPGAFGRVQGALDPDTQSRIITDYLYNVAYGARMLVQKWDRAPKIGDEDPTEVENWYYALWAYNGWGWVNNPNNPRFTRSGTPVTNPGAFPYQERVLYLVSHPPKDRAGNPLWTPVPVTLPRRKQIGRTPHSYVPARTHREAPLPLSAVYSSRPLRPLAPGGSETVTVRVVNTGTVPWLAGGDAAPSLSYHVLTPQSNPWQALSPFTPGVVAFGQDPVVVPGNIAPGGSATIRSTVVAPQKPGTYRIAWDLELGTQGWFSALGALPHVEELRVGGFHAAPTPKPTPTPTTHPALDLRYVADTSVPDGTVLPPHSVFTKGWLVMNSGRAAWRQGDALHLISGPSFGGKVIAMPFTPPCRAANIVVSLRTPKYPGTYQSMWRMEDAQGEAFGDPLTLVVAVKRSPSGTPVPTPGSLPTPPRLPTPTATPVG